MGAYKYFFLIKNKLKNGMKETYRLKDFENNTVTTLIKYNNSKINLLIIISLFHTCYMCLSTVHYKYTCI